MKAPLTLLLVEDLADLRVVLRRTLVAHGYQVLEAGDAEEALRLADGDGVSIDLLLTDWQLPRMNGRELARSLAARHPAVKVLLTSGQLDALAEGMDWLEGRGEYLAKPYDLDVMLAALRRLCRPS
jgi:DNA-binding response OmpR family regulator